MVQLLWRAFWQFFRKLTQNYMTQQFHSWVIPVLPSVLGLPTKYHRLSSLNNRNLISHRAGGQKSKITVPTGLISGEACRWPPSCRVLIWPFLCARALLVSLPFLLIRIPVVLDQGPTLMTSFNFSYLLRGPICKYSHTGVRASTYEFQGGHNSVHNNTKK